MSWRFRGSGCRRLGRRYLVLHALHVKGKRGEGLTKVSDAHDGAL